MNARAPAVPEGYPANALAFAIDLARRAGEIVRQVYSAGPRQIASKQTAVDLITEADLASERLITEAIQGTFPDHMVYAEEASGARDFLQAAQARAGVWMIDPLDGTTNFAHGIPIFGISIALQWQGTLVVGVVYDPIRRVCYWAEAGKGAWCEGRRLHVSRTRALNRCVLATGFSYDRATNPDNNTREVTYLVPRVRGLRRMGAACLDLALVAEGRLDGYWEARLNPWDWAAGALLVREAGGTVTDYEGRFWQPGMRTCIASNGHVHQALQSSIQAARRWPLPPMPDDAIMRAEV